MEFPWNSTGIPLGIHGNPQELHIPTIPADSQWNSNIPWDSGGIRRNSWRRVKYCNNPAAVVGVDATDDDIPALEVAPEVQRITK